MVSPSPASVSPTPSAASATLAPAATVSKVDSLSLRMLQRSLVTEADSKVRTVFIHGKLSDLCSNELLFSALF